MTWSGAEENLYRGLRASLRAQVGDATLLPTFPALPVVRVVVVDTAPDAPHGAIVPGVNRHGDTLAHLIEDVVCLPPRSPQERQLRCAAEVTTALALPRLSQTQESTTSGGHFGSLPDLAEAILRATQRWEDDLKISRTAPQRLILNISLGWEHTKEHAECSPAAAEASLTLPELAVRAAVRHAASRGAQIFAAAGNDAGGTPQREGLTCPGAYQTLPRPGATDQAILLAVSAVNYADRPMLSARPHGRTGIVALGFGGVAWREGEALPPKLVGSSVSTAIASAVAALTWTQQPTWAPYQLGHAIYNSGVPVGDADQCAHLFNGCHARRANVCGALLAAGALSVCQPPLAQQHSSPSLPSQFAALASWMQSTQTNQQVATLLPATDPTPIPHHAMPSIQVQPWTFPMPISATCPTCWVPSAMPASSHQLYIPSVELVINAPMLVVPRPGATADRVPLGAQLAPGQSYRFTLQGLAPFDTAYITGYNADNTASISEELIIAH